MRNKAVIMTVALIASLSIFLSGCTGIFETDDSVNAAGYVTMDINPSIDFVVNGDDEVEDIILNNEDAEVMLSDVIDQYIGQDVDDVSEDILDKAIEMGYIDVDATETDPESIIISATDENDNEERESFLRNKLKNRVNDHLENNGIFGKAVTGSDMKEIVTEAKDMNISPGKLRMMKTVIALSDEYNDIAQLEEFETGEIVSLIKESRTDLNHKLSDEEAQTRRNQKRSENEEKFNEWKQRKENNLGQQIRNQIKDWQDQREENPDEWEKSIGERLADRFSNRGEAEEDTDENTTDEESQDESTNDEENSDDSTNDEENTDDSTNDESTDDAQDSTNDDTEPTA